MKSENKFIAGDHITFVIGDETYNGSFIRHHTFAPDMCTIKNTDVIERTREVTNGDIRNTGVIDRTREMTNGEHILVQPGTSIVIRADGITPVSPLKESNPNISFKKRKRVCWRCGRKVVRYLMKRRIYEHKDTGDKVPFCHDCAAIIEREEDSTNIQENNNKWIARE